MDRASSTFRNPEPKENAAFVAPALGHAVYFHRLGTPQSEDKHIRVSEAQFPLIHTVDVTADGRYGVIYSTALSGGNALAIGDLTSSDWPVRTVVEAFEHTWLLAGNVGTKLFLSTQKGAARGKMVTVDLADPEPAFVDLIAEREDAVLRFGTTISSPTENS